MTLPGVVSGAAIVLGSFLSVAEAQAPKILAQPTNEVVLAGSAASFSVAVSGTGPFTDQWQFNGTNLLDVVITTVAGNGTEGYAGDGGAATKAESTVPCGVAVDSSGNLFIADTWNNVVRKVGTDGNLYGATSQGGVGGQGTVFQITTNGLLTTLFWFNGTNGANPQSTLIQARDGAFYGTTEFGGSQYDGADRTGDGLVFRLTLPMFLASPFAQAVATAGAPYAASLSTNAVQPTGDALAFAKVAGPAWFNIAGDGVLSGTPAVPDIGTSSFSVSLADTNGWSNTLRSGRAALARLEPGQGGGRVGWSALCRFAAPSPNSTCPAR